MKKMFKLGCAGLGIQASSKENPVSLTELPILEQFKLVKEAEVFDFIDRIPNDHQELDEYIKDIFVKSYEFGGIYIVSVERDTIKKHVKKYDFMGRVGKL